MSFLTSFMAAFQGIMRFMAGQTAARETTKLIRNVRIALIAVAAVCAAVFVCLLIISAYFLVQIIHLLF